MRRAGIIEGRPCSALCLQVGRRIKPFAINIKSYGDKLIKVSFARILAAEVQDLRVGSIVFFTETSSIWVLFCTLARRTRRATRRPCSNLLGRPNNSILLGFCDYSNDNAYRRTGKHIFEHIRVLVITAFDQGFTPCAGW